MSAPKKFNYDEVHQNISKNGSMNHPYRVVDDYSDGSGIHYAVIEFVNPHMRNGKQEYTRRTINAKYVDKQFIKDYYQPTICGECSVGNIKTRYPNGPNTREYTTYIGMVHRCCDPEFDSYQYYGGSGVTISDEWHCYEDFYNSLPEVEGYEEWKNSPVGEYTLDKDINQDGVENKVYSKETCKFVKVIDNQMEKSIRKHNDDGLPIVVFHSNSKEDGNYIVKFHNKHIATYSDPDVAGLRHANIIEDNGGDNSYELSLLSRMPEPYELASKKVSDIPTVDGKPRMYELLVRDKDVKFDINNFINKYTP